MVVILPGSSGHSVFASRGASSWLLLFDPNDSDGLVTCPGRLGRMWRLLAVVGDSGVSRWLPAELGEGDAPVDWLRARSLWLLLHCAGVHLGAIKRLHLRKPFSVAER